MKEIPTRNCLSCKALIVKSVNCSRKYWETNYKYCSTSCSKKGNKNRLGVSRPAWNKGIPATEEAKANLRAKMPDIAKTHGLGKWMLGKKQSEETRKKKSEAAKAVVARGEHNFYVDGRTPINQKIRHSLEYKFWRESVFERDDYTCIECGDRGVYLNADHIKPFAYFPELRFSIENGRTLCVPCHTQTDTYKGRALAYAT